MYQITLLLLGLKKINRIYLLYTYAQTILSIVKMKCACKKHINFVN